MDKFLTVLSVAGLFVALVSAFLSILYIRELRRYQQHMSQPHVLHRIAAHEAGHAVAVMAVEGVEAELKLVTIVHTNEYGGQVSYTMEGFPYTVNREAAIVRLSGAAAEFIARDEVYAEGCARDLEEALSLAVDMVVLQGMRAPPPPMVAVDVATLLPDFGGKGVLGGEVHNLLNSLMHEAIQRLKKKEATFYKVIQILLDRREIKGWGLYRLLQESNENV